MEGHRKQVSTKSRGVDMSETTYCNGAVIQIAANNIDDKRGTLCPIEFPILGFLPVRAFVVNGVSGVVRGGHGHKNSQQLFMLVSGEIEVELRYQNTAETILLDRDNRLLLLKPKVWAKQEYLTKSASLLVFSDIHHDPDDYFQDKPGLTGQPS